MSDPVQTMQVASTAVASFSVLLTELTNLVPKLVTAAAFLATILPAPRSASSGVYKAIYEAVNALGFNFGKAKNKE